MPKTTRRKRPINIHHYSLPPQKTIQNRITEKQKNRKTETRECSIRLRPPAITTCQSQAFQPTNQVPKQNRTEPNRTATEVKKNQKSKRVFDEQDSSSVCSYNQQSRVNVFQPSKQPASQQAQRISKNNPKECPTKTNSVQIMSERGHAVAVLDSQGFEPNFFSFFQAPLESEPELGSVPQLQLPILTLIIQAGNLDVNRNLTLHTPHVVVLQKPN